MVQTAKVTRNIMVRKMSVLEKIFREVSKELEHFKLKRKLILSHDRNDKIKRNMSVAE